MVWRYGYPGKVPRNLSQIMDSEASARLCFHLHRTGPLCGECEDNYTLPAYSYYLGCVRCESYKNGWIKFIAAAFLPLTLFYMVVIAFRISATSPTLNAFVMANQVLAIPRVVRRVYSNNLMIDPYHVSYLGQISVDFIIAVVAIWNLDFFRSFYLPICLHPYLKYQHVDMTSRDYLPYLVLAAFMLTTFNILPLLLLILIPSNVFKDFLISV